MKKLLHVYVPEWWVPQLKQLAREHSYLEHRNVSYAELIRKAIADTYNLKEPS